MEDEVALGQMIIPMWATDLTSQKLIKTAVLG
jgi:hypothetical protein